MTGNKCESVESFILMLFINYQWFCQCIVKIVREAVWSHIGAVVIHWKNQSIQT